MTFFRLTPLLVAVLWIGCTGESDVPASAQISTESLAFGEVPLEGDSTQTVTLSNPGTEPLSLFSVTLVSGDSQVLRGGCSRLHGDCGRIERGHRHHLCARRPGDVFGQIQIRTSDPSGDAVSVDLTGTGTPSQADNDEDGVSGADGDCDDARADVFPGAPELCDGRDNDCDGVVPSNEADADRDGVRVCADDCNDDDDNIFPGAPEICDDADSNCDGANNDRADIDGDGFSICDDDCDDNEVRTFPGATEVCDGIDNDCLDGIDDLDADGDGHSICFVVPDCDDDDPTAFPVIVDASASEGGDGSEATPFNTLGAGLGGIDATCRTVYVADGTYEINATVSTDVLVVGAGAELTVFTAAEGNRPMRITGGAVSLTDLSFVDAAPAEDGGALRLDGGDVTLERVHFTGNQTTGGDGGAVAVSSGIGLTVRDSRFESNTASDDGGAIAAFAGDIVIEDSVFLNNTGADGGAVLADQVSLTVRDSVFETNIGTESGGGVNVAGGDVSVVRTDFYGNEANLGGGLWISAADGTVSNSVFHANGATDGSGLLATGNVSLSLSNSTFVANGPTGGAVLGAAVSVTGGSVDATSLLGMFNQGNGCAGTGDALSITYSTFFSTVGTDWGTGCDADDEGNTTVNPLFVSVDGDSQWTDDNLSLASGSPARNSGNPDDSFDDANGSRNDRGHTGGPQAQP